MLSPLAEVSPLTQSLMSLTCSKQRPSRAAFLAMLLLQDGLQVGWPMMLPSKERRQFAGKVHDLKKKHLNNMVMDGKLPLRPGMYKHVQSYKPHSDPSHQMLCPATLFTRQLCWKGR